MKGKISERKSRAMLHDKVTTPKASMQTLSMAPEKTESTSKKMEFASQATP